MRLRQRSRAVRARPSFRKVLAIGAAMGAVVLSSVVSVQSRAGAGPTADPNGPTGSHDVQRTSYYPNQTALSMVTVSGPMFGSLWNPPPQLNGQIYAQPLLVNGTLLVATETNWIYGLDPNTGAIRWSRQLGSPFNPIADAFGCRDLQPWVGITGTPTVDPDTGIAYLVSKAYVPGTNPPYAYQWMHAIDPATGQEQPGFPFHIGGVADNNPAMVFKGPMHLQRPALLLIKNPTNGVKTVYAAFASHCDNQPYEGWIAGITTAGQRAALWTTLGSGALGTVSGAGIWQSGGGLMSDGINHIWFDTGNAFGNASPSGIRGNPPPPNLGESAVRIKIQSNGQLTATDFFTPRDAAFLDAHDLDFGSGSMVALPGSPFGTIAHPHLAAAVGKEGNVYILDRDALGGVGLGPGGGDNYVYRLGGFLGIWSSPAVWPGNGGYIYVATTSLTTGGHLHAFKFSTVPNISISNAGQSPDVFSFGSGRPVVTSTGNGTGDPIVWVIRDNGGSGTGATLDAYNAIPNAGSLTLIGRWPIGTTSKFAQPLPANGRIYVGTRDGTVLAFGPTVFAAANVTALPTTFAQTPVGSTQVAGVTLRATKAVSINKISVDGPDFAVTLPALPVRIEPGRPVTVPVVFTPTASAVLSGTMTIDTNRGRFAVALVGKGQPVGPSLAQQIRGDSMGGISVGGTLTGTATFSNEGTMPLTITGVTAPATPFRVVTAPPAGTIIPPGGHFDVTTAATPASPGVFGSDYVVESDGGNKDVMVTASAS